MKPLYSAMLLVLNVLTAHACFAKDSAQAFISSEKDDAITVINLKTAQITGLIKTCKRPRHMQLAAGATQLMVACSNSGKADVIDIATKKSITRIDLGEDPEIFDVSPDGKTIYVSNEEDGELNMIEASSGKKLKSVKIGKEPEGVKVSADGKTVYVTSEVANMVHVIETNSGKVIKNILVGKRPRRFALTPDNKELWVSNELDASISVIDIASLAVKDTIKLTVPGARETDITPVGLVISQDGKTLYAGLGRANHIASIDVATKKQKQLALVGKRAWSLSLNRAQDQLYVLNGLSDDLTIVDVNTFKATKTIAVGRVPHTIVLDD